MSKAFFKLNLMYPTLIFSWPAVFLSMLLALLFSLVWYGPLFGKLWARWMENPGSDHGMSRSFTRSLPFQIVGLFLTTYVLAHTCQIWRPSVWGVGADGSNFMYGYLCGLFTWIGFYIPHRLSRIVSEETSWKFFFMNTGHDFFMLQLISQILSHWR